jgi:hypothetical protein
MSLRTALGLAFALAAGAVGLPEPAPALNDEGLQEGLGFEITPPRLSFADGSVSFLRSGDDDWSPARVNTPLAAGDELYSAEGSNLELQIGARASVRGGEKTQLGLTSLEPDFLQFRLTSGHLALDLRTLKPGQTIEVATPHAAFTVERTGYYRVEVAPDASSFTSRRGGSAQLTLPSGVPAEVASGEQVVVKGDGQLETYAAPDLDTWDRWNYARTDDQQGTVSARYVPSDVYGVSDLDAYGDWRVVPTYGSVWVPRRVAVGWVPYSTGTWLHDPYYGWSWVDDAPWGWAPYHYGRWVYVSGFWGWYPGPVIARAYYAPALVAFYGGGVSFGIRPSVGWVALGWGEPLIPWWGPTYFRGRPCWTGWHGKRDSHWAHHGGHHHGGHRDGRHGGHHGDGHDRDRWDRDRDHRGDGDHDRDRWDRDRDGNFHRYKNAQVKDAIVATDRDHFGRRSKSGERTWRARADQLKPLDRDLDVAPDASSRVARRGRAERPPRELGERAVVATRAPANERGFAARGDAERASWRESRDDGDRARTAAAGREPQGSARGFTQGTPRTRVVEPKRDDRNGQDRNRQRVAAAERPSFDRSDAVPRTPPPSARIERPARNGRDGERNQSEARGGSARRATPPEPPARLEQPTHRRHFDASRDRGERVRAPREAAPAPPREPARASRRGDERGGDERDPRWAQRTRPNTEALPRVDAAPPRRSERAQPPRAESAPRWSQRQAPQREAVAAPRVERSAPRVERSAPRADAGRAFDSGSRGGSRDGGSSGGSWQRSGRSDGGNAGGGRSRGDGGGRGSWQGGGRGGEGRGR